MAPAVHRCKLDELCRVCGANYTKLAQNQQLKNDTRACISVLRLVHMCMHIGQLNIITNHFLRITVLHHLRTGVVHLKSSC